MSEFSGPISRKEMISRCARDRDRVLAELEALRPQFAGAKPCDCIKAAIRTVCGFRVAPRVLFPGQLGLCDFQSKIVYYNANMDFVNHQTSPEGLINSSLAHELAHIRLHSEEIANRYIERRYLAKGVVSHLGERDFQREQEADLYAAIFLVPGRFLVREKSAQQLYRWHKQRKTVKASSIWRRVYDLAKRFKVTPSLMRRCLVELGWISSAPLPNGGFRLWIRFPEPEFE